MIDDKSKCNFISFGFFYCLSAILLFIYFFLDEVVISSRGFRGEIIVGMLFFAIFIATFFTFLYYISLIFIFKPKENSNFSFESKYDFYSLEPVYFKKQEEDDPDLSYWFCRYSDYINCIANQKNGVSYYMNERHVSSGKYGGYEFICLVKHNKRIPCFYIRQKDLIADTVDKLWFKNKSIEFPEDPVFSRKFILKERAALLVDSKIEDVYAYFDKKVRETFVQYHVFDAEYYSCELNEFKIKVNRRLKESEKEKIFLLACTLFGENDVDCELRQA